MLNEIKYNNIYIVDCDPSFGHEYKKRRPAVVIQADSITQHSNLVSVVLMTSNLSKKIKDDILIVKDPENCLLKDSIIRVAQIAGFDKRRFLQHVGKINKLIESQIKNYLRKHFVLK
jgi:mRNA interferase MazF